MGLTGKRDVYLDTVTRSRGEERIVYTSREAMKRFVEQCDELAATVGDNYFVNGGGPPPVTESGRPHREILEAIQRVRADGPVTLATLAEETGIALFELLDWIRTGKDGHFLDRINKGHAGWFSSHATIERFAASIDNTARTLTNATEERHP